MPRKGIAKFLKTIWWVVASLSDKSGGTAEKKIPSSWIY